MRLGGFLRNKKISNYIYIDKITLTFNNNQGEVNLINGLVLNKKSTDDKFDFKYFIKKKNKVKRLFKYFLYLINILTYKKKIPNY